MKTLFNGILIGTILGFAIAGSAFLYFQQEQSKAVKAETIRETLYAVRQQIIDQTNIRVDVFDMDNMSDDQLIEFTGKRSVEYRKRFIDPNFKRDP